MYINSVNNALMKMFANKSNDIIVVHAVIAYFSIVLSQTYIFG